MTKPNETPAALAAKEAASFKPCARCGGDKPDHPFYGVCAEWHAPAALPDVEDVEVFYLEGKFSAGVAAGWYYQFRYRESGGFFRGPFPTADAARQDAKDAKEKSND